MFVINFKECAYHVSFVCFCLSFYIAVYEELKTTGKFEDMNIDVDEAEHSMEMHLPYLAKVFHGYTDTSIFAITYKEICNLRFTDFKMS